VAVTGFQPVSRFISNRKTQKNRLTAGFFIKTLD